MKKQLLCLIAALVLLLGLCVSALAYDSAHVFDDAQLLSEDEIGALPGGRGYLWLRCIYRYDR